MIRFPVLAAAFAAALLAGRAAGAAPTTVETGVINGAKFAIATPTVDWNHSVLILAPGSRPEGAPLLADLHPGRPSLRVLLDEGWIVATTSYRRTGIVVADSIADIDALRAHIADAYGAIDRAILAGDSVGGLIVTIMAEREPGGYQGAVAFDPTFYINEQNSGVGLSLLPRIPLLFVATERESAQARAYVTSLVSRPPPAMQPALFLVSRQGHANFNQGERLGSLRALLAWVDRGREALPQPQEGQLFFNATVAPDPGPSTAVPHPGGFATRVAEVDAVYGTVLLEAQAQDFEAAGIPLMGYFQLSSGTGKFRVRYARNYSDVQSGQWVAFADADGRTDLALLQGNAAAAALVRPGDTVSVDAIPR